MTNGSWFALSALSGLLATSAAHASLITIDADAYAPGTNVSNVFDGVSLAHLTFQSGTGLQSSSVYAAGCADVSNPRSPCSAIGPAAFGYQTSTGTISGYWYSSGSPIINCLRQNYSYCYSTPQHLLEVSFDTATDFVQFDSTYVSDFPWVWALDAAGNVLSLTAQITIHQSSGPGGGPFGYQTVTLASAGTHISRIVIAGNGGYATVDSMTNDVPPPMVRRWCS